MKTLIRLLAVIALVGSLLGCGALTVQVQPARKLVQEDVPVVGAVTRADLGEKMMIQKDYEVATGVMLPVTRVSGGLGMPWDLSGFYEITTDRHFCGVTTYRDPLNNGKMVRTCYTEAEFRGHIPVFTTTEVITPRVGNIQRILEYTGRSDNRLTFSYKEYNETKDGVFIRPAYTQDFTFDLSQGSEIGVKGARVKVIEATNTGITYEVLKHFPK